MELPPLPSERVHRSIAVDYNPEEYAEFSFVMLRERLRATTILYLIIASVGIAFSLFVPEDINISARYLMGGAGAFLLVFPLYQRASIRAMTRKLHESPNNALHVKRATTLDDQGVRTDGHDGSYSYFPWSAVREIREEKLAIYLVLSAQLALIVPRRSFPSDRDGHEFIQFAKLHLASNEKPVSS